MGVKATVSFMLLFLAANTAFSVCPSVTLNDLNHIPPGVSFRVSELSQWFLPTTEKKQGVVLMVHGLNLKPSKMTPLAEFLRDSGMVVLRHSLLGHRGWLEEFTQVTRQAWLDHLYQAYCVAQAKATLLRLPLYFVGYSIGGVLNLDLMASFPRREVKYEKMALFAPAISVWNMHYLIKLLRLFGKTFVVPSWGLKDYRLYGGTPMAAYLALFESISALENESFLGVNIPTVVWIHPKDELVRPSGIHGAVTEYRLSKWEVESIDNSERRRKDALNHLIINESVLGRNQWEQVTERLSSFFRP